MTLDEALMLFKSKKAPVYLYTIGGLGDGDCWGIEHGEDGSWTVYFSERGARRNPRLFATEADAVAYFVSKVDGLMREYTGHGMN
ncbi:hypothetical protein [Methylosinus sp. Ce-a6]|uniref:hypothetical protein n=1 Tax=Methylosinus sp. Ce-a6 TaxID=2172005 RepID=UPI00135940E1|nr:hypothetical protein [Methylosinus sp. Ce-a6]